jgi:hypothetical protein
MKIHKICGDKLVSIQTYHESTPSNGVKRSVLPVILQEQDVYYVGWFVAENTQLIDSYDHSGINIEYFTGEDVSHKSFGQFKRIVESCSSMKIFRSSGALKVCGREYNVCQLVVKDVKALYFHAFISEGVTKSIAEATYMRFYLGI